MALDTEIELEERVCGYKNCNARFKVSKCHIQLFCSNVCMCKDPRTPLKKRRTNGVYRPLPDDDINPNNEM